VVCAVARVRLSHTASMAGKWVHEDNSTVHLHMSQEQLKKFMAKRNLRKGIEAVTAIKKLQLHHTS
jgi:hypothetical protein